MTKLQISIKPLISKPSGRAATIEKMDQSRYLTFVDTDDSGRKLRKYQFQQEPNTARHEWGTNRQ